MYADRDAPADALDRRARWLDLLDDVQAGYIDVVAAYDTSRLWRSVELRIATCRELAKAGVARIATMAGAQPTDLTEDPEGNFMATVLAAAAEFDNRLRALKGKRGRRHAAENGRPHFAGRRPWDTGTCRTTPAVGSVWSPLTRPT